MKDLIRLTDLHSSEIYKIFNIADEISCKKYNGFLKSYDHERNVYIPFNKKYQAIKNAPKQLD